MSRRGRKRKEEDEEEKVADGEQDYLSSDEIRKEIEMMWEIPQIFQFFHLTRESLNVPQFSLYEMERMLLIPRASKQLANIMTCLLSSPITKAKLRKVPPMPYEFWTNILAHKIGNWFKVYHAKHKDAAKVLEIIGIEPEFWNIFPDATLLDGKDFENLTFKQRVWLLKTVCDTIMHTRKTVQEDIAKQPWEDQFETVLGTDRYGARYIYFPKFIPNLRIYRHCLDNKILSTVKPVKAKQGMETNKLIGERLNRYKQRKLQSHGNLSDRKSSRRESKMNEKTDKDVNSCKSDNNPMGSFISDDTNLSSSSTCSNNNNISLEVISRKGHRVSEENTLPSVKSAQHKFDKSVDDESSQMFKGFANSIKDNSYSIGIITEMLDNLESEINEDKERNECRNSDSTESASQGNHGNLMESCKNTIDFHSEVSVAEKDESERSSDNLSSSSKTDDEKLNEIIGAEYSKSPESTYSKCVSVDDNISDNNSMSKSDDEKLNETKTSNVSINGNSSTNGVLALNGSLHAYSNDSVLLNEKVITRERFSKAEVSPQATRLQARLSDLSEERTLRKRTKLRFRYSAIQCNKTDGIEATKAEEELKEEKMNKTDFSTSDIHLQEDLDAVNDYINCCDADYDLQRPKELKTDEYKQHFNKILTDLSVSDFQLVVDSVEGLRDLIGSFSVNDLESSAKIKIEAIPACELKLVTKLTELLSSLEVIETTLKDVTRKAKAKLQREWTNFKEGSVEDQDSSGESGLSSNWWVLGSQGKDPLSTTGDATLQTLSQFAIPSLGAQSTNQQQPVQSEHKNAVDNSTEESHHEIQERTNNERQSGIDEKQADIKDSSPARNQVQEGEEKRETKQCDKDEDASKDEVAEQQTRRVLRARGISSYTEQFYSDYESDENELEGWTDIEAVYAAPGAQANTSAAHAAPKVGHTDDGSEQEEDSDQDWILPSSRKRKNKRPSANRRLKSFQHKVQSITENTSESNRTFDNVLQSINAKISRDKHKTKSKNNSECREAESKPIANSAQLSTDRTVTSNNTSSKRQAFSDAICKIETIASVHSELNIEDDVIYEIGSADRYRQNSYNSSSAQQNYYYMVPQNPRIAQNHTAQRAPIIQQTDTIVQQIASPQLQQGYYMQPNYTMQTPNFPLVAQQQQPVFSRQNPQLIPTTQPYSNNANYVSHAIPVNQSRTKYVTTSGLNPRDPVLCTPRPNRFNQNNRQSIRGKTPARGGCQRSANPASVRDDQTVRQSCSNASNAKRRTAPQSANVKRMPQAASTEKTTPRMENSGQKTMSLIMLSDSDDEIEMIITEKAVVANTEKAVVTNTEKRTSRERAISPQQPQQNVAESKARLTVTSDIAIDSTKGISPQIIQRMSQGGISITPIKSTPPPSAPNGGTQLVVVVNETGSHYALALPNGSKLILTPEQVAQIRASNGGKLIL